MTVQVLFIDDEPEFVRAHIDTLNDAGYNVTHVRTYTEAREALRQQGFNLIILDLVLPPGEVDPRSAASEPSAEVGLELHKVIRKELGLQTPIIFFTVVNEMEARRQIQEVEAKYGVKAAILVKPLLPGKLLTQVRRLAR